MALRNLILSQALKLLVTLVEYIEQLQLEEQCKLLKNQNGGVIN